MKKDLFRRNTRMTHRFGKAEHDDPLGDQTFNPQFPKGVTDGGSKPLTVKAHGQHRYCPDLSGVISPTGHKASLNGPAPDYADEVTAMVPANSKRRKTP